MRSAPNFGDLLLDRRPSHFVPPEMRDRILLDLPSASGSGPARSFASLVTTPTTVPGRAPHALVEVPGRREQLVQVPVPGHRHLGPLAGVDDESQVFFYIIAGERFPLKTPDLPGLRWESSR